MIQEIIEIDRFIQYINVFRKRLLFLNVYNACIFSKAPIGPCIKNPFVQVHVIKPIFWKQQ